jgi:transposase
MVTEIADVEETMRGRHIVVAWQHTADELRNRWEREQVPAGRKRLHGLWLLRTGHRVGQVAAVLGVHDRSVREWLAWYREGGLAPVLQRRRGGGRGQPSRLSATEETELVAEAAAGRFHAIAEACQWVAERYGKTYSYFGMRSVFRRLRIGKKVPRPLAQKASEEAQAAWEKGVWQPF